MRVVYYSRPSFLDHVLPQVRALSQLVELHLVLELSPEMWKSSLFDLAPRSLPTGVIRADSVFQSCFPAGVRRYWQDCANFFLVVHNCSRTIHPRTWWVSHKATKFIRSLKPDIIHLDDVSPRMASSVSELGNIPVVLTIHDPERHSGEINWRSVLARWWTLRQGDRFVLHTNGFRESLASRYKVPYEKIDVIPLGVLDVFREWMDSAVRSGDRTVLFFGRLSIYKGLEVLYEAAPLVTERVPNVHFIVAGRPVPGYEPPAPPPLENDSHIEVHSDYVTNSELARFFQMASVVVCPYIDATQSGVVLTAYAFDKPVVATETGGLPEYVIHNQTGILIPPNDPGALSDALVEVLSNRELMDRLTEGVREIKDGQLSWDAIGKRTMEVYEKTILGNTDPAR
ncbi:MAG: glycosyltransferase family 4 protein [Candidatus Glassbacteria bacterium]